MRKTGRILALLLVLSLMVLSFSQPVLASEDANYNVRVGLVSTYGDKSSITIKNTSVKFGYEVDGQFVENMTLNSENGFTVYPNTSYCYGSVAIYGTYAEAVAAINKYKIAGEYVTVGVQGNGAYRIYIYSNDALTSASYAASLEHNGKGKYEAVANDMKYRTKLTWAEGSMIIDVDSAGLYPQFAAATANDVGVYVLDLGDRQYRGRMEIGRFGGAANVTAVSVLGMEEYLYGVVACEMVPSWELEALKAQAVCARSYAYGLDKHNATFGAEFGYALYDTTKSQVYKGYGSEYEKTNQAVDATRGEMIYYRENVVKSYFYSTSGGHTANCEDVWTVALTYFRAVPDNTELHQEKKPWIVAKTMAEIEADLADEGINVGSVTKLTPQIRTTSGRIFQLKVAGSAGSDILKREEISSTFSLPSTKVKIITSSDVPDKVYVQSQNENVKKQISQSYVISGDGAVSQVNQDLEQYIVISEDNLTNFPKAAPAPGTIYFAGMGYGHGVGMSQSGAQSLAMQGYDYKYILHHYYNKVDIR